MHLPNTPTRPAPPARRLALAGAAALLLAASAAFSAPAANAHDGLIGTEPSNGKQVAEAPESATLRFSGELKAIGSQVRVTDGDGTSIGATPSVQGRTLEVAFDEELPDGEYTIAWRVVSSDGHPIEGTTGNGQALRFAVEGENTTSAPASPARPSASAKSAAPASSMSPRTDSPATTSETSAASQGADAQSPSPVPWVVAAGIVVLGAAAYLLMRARRRRH